MKNIFLTTMLIIASLQLPAREILRVGYLEYPPLTYMDDNGHASGEFIDILKKKLNEKYVVQWIQLPPARHEWALDNNVIDLYPMLVATRERREKYYISEKPTVSVQPYYCSLTHHDNLKQILADLPGKTVIVPLKSKYQTLYPYLADEQISILPITYENYIERSILLLKRRSADYVIVPSMIGHEQTFSDARINCMAIDQKIYIYWATTKNSIYLHDLKIIFRDQKTIEF